MNPDAYRAVFEEREWRVDEGDWVAQCVSYFSSPAFGGRFVVLWKLLAGPYMRGTPRWRHDQSELAKVLPGYDDPLAAIIPRYYPAKVGDHVSIKRKSDLARDWFRLTGQNPPRYDRFPVTEFPGRIAVVRIVDVTLDHQELPCPPYSRVCAILSPASGVVLSNESEENAEGTKG
ncbi:MAG TPA: hypothetical protein VGK20_11600 [Candidatus Binatia bacterium]|jgi:hypothetical protein